MKLSTLGEFGLIKRLQKKCTGISSDVLAGIGDDAAVLKGGNKKILVTTDMLIEGVHFELSFTTFYELGHKFLSVNISDILAMGGRPKHFLISLGIPERCDADNISELYSGINAVAGKFGIGIIGGDTCASKQGLVLSGTLIGNTDRAILRTGAKEGDGIFVTDTLGDSAMGLLLLESQRGKNKNLTLTFKSPDSKTVSINSKLVLPLMKKHLMPQPAPLKNLPKVTAMIDVSDGLLADLSHICDESKVGAVIYKEKIPLSGELKSLADKMGRDPFDFALSGGEDYVLLFTAPSNFRTKAFKIGEIIKKGRYIVDDKGRKTAFKAKGYEHFKKQ